MQETLRHQQAFEYYYMLGANRNYSKVAEHFGVSNVSVTKWADAFGWKNKVQEKYITEIRTDSICLCINCLAG